MYMPCNYYQPMQGSCSQSEQPAKRVFSRILQSFELDRRCVTDSALAQTYTESQVVQPESHKVHMSIHTAH